MPRTFLNNPPKGPKPGPEHLRTHVEVIAANGREVCTFKLSGSDTMTATMWTIDEPVLEACSFVVENDYGALRVNRFDGKEHFNDALAFLIGQVGCGQVLDGRWGVR